LQPIAPDERTEFGVGELLGPRGKRVIVNVARGDALHRVNVQRAYGWMASQNLSEYMRISKLPFLSAVDFVQSVYLPFSQYSNLQIMDLKPLQQDKAYFAVSYHTSQGIRMIEEGFLDNSSVPDPMGGDFNLFTISHVKAPADISPGEKNDLWKILYSFEPSPRFGAPMIQFVAQLRSQSLEAARNMIMDRLRSNQEIARQHAGIAQQKPGLMAQQGQGWINAVMGQEVIRDPQTGQRYQVLVGGEYIYGRNTGEIIRADRPLQTHELPEGFRQFEAVGVR